MCYNKIMLTKDLEIPNKPTEQPFGWSIRRLLSMGGSLGKVISFFNPFEFILLTMILISGITEIMGRHVSWFWYIILFLVLLVAFAQRQQKVEPEKKPEETKTK